MPKRRDFYAEHAESEALLRSKLVGTLAKLRRIPPRVWIPGESYHRTAPIIRRQQLDRLRRSTWWSAPWAEYLESTTETLERIARDSTSPLIRRYAGRISQAAQARTEANAIAAAREYAASLAAQIEADTLAGLRAALDGIPRGLPATELRAQLAARLGPTPKQLAKIHRWERRALAEGKLTRREILAELKGRARRSSLARARPMASDALVRQASESRAAVFSAAGVLVSSGNPLDGNTRDGTDGTLDHYGQTVETRRNPTPAGEPWAPSAPIQGLPPYEIYCRCWVEAAE